MCHVTGLGREEYKKVYKKFVKGEVKLLKKKQCINGKRYNNEISKDRVYLTFYTKHLCEDCADKCLEPPKF